MPGTSGMGTELRGANGRSGITCGVAVAFCACRCPKYPAAAITMTTAVVILKIHNRFADGALIYFFSPTAHRTKLMTVSHQSRKLCVLACLLVLHASCQLFRHQQDRSSSLRCFPVRDVSECPISTRVVCAYCSGIFFPLSFCWGILIACECRKKVDSNGWRYL